jgi:hypothetical protein
MSSVSVRTDAYSFGLQATARENEKFHPMLEMENPDPHGLATQAAEWRRRALRGDRDARGIAHALEVQVRRLRGGSPTAIPDLDTRPLADWQSARPWWKPW